MMRIIKQKENYYVEVGKIYLWNTLLAYSGGLGQAIRYDLDRAIRSYLDT